MQRFVAFSIAFLVTWIASSPLSNAAEGSRARIREVLAEAQYSNAASVVLDAILTAKDARNCDFFGYRIRCTRRYLTLAERKKVKYETAKMVPQALKVLSKAASYSPIDRLTIVNAFRSPKDRDENVVPILASAPYPGFIPLAAYDGAVSPLYEALNHSFEYHNEAPKPQQDKFDALAQDWIVGRSIYDSTTDTKALLVSVPTGRYETLLHQEFDFRGHDLFGDFAESDRVAEGQKLVEFWENYVSFSRTADLRSCASLCNIAVELTSPRDHIRSIAYCSVISVSGVPGSPENCYTVFTSDGAKSYLRVSLYLNAISGLDGIGGDEVSCDPVPALTKADIDTIASAVADDLRKINTKPTDPTYAVEISKKAANRTVLMAARFGLSAFFRNKTTYEISTTRVDLTTEEDSRVTASIALTAAISFTHDLNQDAYKLLQDAESTAMRGRIIELLAPSLTCKTSRGR